MVKPSASTWHRACQRTSPSVDMRFLDAVTGSQHIREFMKGLHVLNFNNYYKKFNELYDLVKANAGDLERPNLICKNWMKE